MARKDSLDARADEILRILDETPETPATRAAAALAQARDAGDGALRQQHVQEAQAYLAQINPRDGRTVQRLQAQVLALQGRGGDTRIALSPRARSWCRCQCSHRICAANSPTRRATSVSIRAA